MFYPSNNIIFFNHCLRRYLRPETRGLLVSLSPFRFNFRFPWCVVWLLIPPICRGRDPDLPEEEGGGLGSVYLPRNHRCVAFQPTASCYRLVPEHLISIVTPCNLNTCPFLSIICSEALEVGWEIVGRYDGKQLFFIVDCDLM